MSTSVDIPQAGSPETQQIVDACYQLSSPGFDARQLLDSLIPARSDEAGEALKSFLSQAADQGEEFRKTHSEALQRVENAFGFYQTALKSVAKAIGEKSPESAVQAAQELAGASFGIRSAVISYEESYLSYGDSRFPLINLLTNLGERVRGGQVPPQTWTTTCQRYGHFFTRSIEEIDDSPDREKPGVQERKASLSQLVGHLKSLENLEPIDTIDIYEDLLFSVSGCLVDLSEAFETYHSHVFLTGESGSPRVNLILKVTQGTLTGTYDKGVLRLLTTSLSDDLQGRLKELDRLATEPQESEVLNDYIADMIDALESMDDALQNLIKLSKGEKVEQNEIQEALDLLLESGDMLGEVNTAVASFNKSSARVTCVGCGAEQGAGQSCLSCGAALPQPESAGVESSFEMQEGKTEIEAGEAVMTTVMQELFDRVDDFDARRMDGDAFLDYIEDFHSKIDVAEDQLSQMHPPQMPDGLSVEDRALCTEFISIADDALSLLELGLAECREGLEHLRHFAETDEKEAKGSGKQLYFDGTQKLWMVQRAQKRVEDFIVASKDMLPPDEKQARSTSSGPTSLSSRFRDEMS